MTDKKKIAAEFHREVVHEAREGFMIRWRRWIREVHWSVLATLMVAWIPVEWGVNAVLHFLGHVIPGIGPFLFDSVLLYMDEIIIALVPIVVGKEILRRLGLWKDLPTKGE